MESVHSDMWIPYFCNSTNITHSRLEIHRTGYAWRYVRASMTLAGLLPPLSDRGSLLVDGGYFSNLPVAEMISELGAVDIIAVDVGSIEDTSPRHYGDSVSGWAVLFSRCAVLRRYIPGRGRYLRELIDVASCFAVLIRSRSDPC